MPTIIFVTPTGEERRVEAPVGVSVMRAAIDANVPGIIADCGGNCACATCHGYVDQAFLGKAGEASEIEREMLDCAIDPQANSRLTCQIVMSDALDGLVIRLPERQL